MFHFRSSNSCQKLRQNELRKEDAPLFIFLSTIRQGCPQICIFIVQNHKYVTSFDKSRNFYVLPPTKETFEKWRR